MGVRLFVLSVALLLILSFAQRDLCFATEEYAERTGKVCAFCHQNSNGGPLNPVGIAYVRNHFEYPIPESILDKSQTLTTPFHRTVRLIVGYLHLIAACVLAGAIFYVHVFVKPSSLTSGIPKGERILGLTCLSVLVITGIYLVWYRIDTLAAFFQSSFGILLFSKLVLFVIMLALALLTVTVVHNRMRQQSSRPPVGHAVFVIDDLPANDGMDGRPAYIAYRDTVYDVSQSPKWKEGSHFRKHSAGRDLTESLAGAPHGEEVFSGIPVVAKLPEEQARETPKKRSGIRRLFVGMAYTNSILVALILLCVASWRWGFPIRAAHPDRTRDARIAESCMACHREKKPGIYADWRQSIHAKVGVQCDDCHAVIDTTSTMVSRAHFEQCDTPVSALVTPTKCAECHLEETRQYSQSKHALTLEIISKIDKWLIHGMNNQIERATGCYVCHGSVVQFTEGIAAMGTWPNVGVGRKNPDGSLGSCTSCHTRHRFSIAEARKPEACGQCHLGPDHPQIEIYNESKHGAIYHAEGERWNWNPDDGHWISGRDYRAPTCASCHMSETGTVVKSHGVTERLAWELQAPLTIRPAEFAPFPAKTAWQTEREKMRSVCLECHSEGWTAGHFQNLDQVVENYNTLYYAPVFSELQALYAAGLMSEESYFDEHLEWEFYEFWHHEGRRARMGAAMMAPDYAWWHGFYELKARFVTFMEEARALQEKRGPSKTYAVFPGQFEEP